MSILVRGEQEKGFFRLKTAVNYGTVKRQAGAEVSRIEVSSLEGFVLSKSTVDIKICLYMYTADSTKFVPEKCKSVRDNADKYYV